jgi:hypothetical protein
MSEAALHIVFGRVKILRLCRRDGKDQKNQQPGKSSHHRNLCKVKKSSQRGAFQCEAAPQRLVILTHPRAFWLELYGSD